MTKIFILRAQMKAIDIRSFIDDNIHMSSPKSILIF